MSDQEEQVPELDSEAKAFLSRHQQTGEPSGEALERARQRLTTAPAPSAKPGEVVRLAPRRRPFVPPEVLAAAAVVTLLLGAQGLYLVMRTPVVETVENQPNAKMPDAEVIAVTEAWRAGEYERAARLASQDCHSAACGPLASDIAKMLGLTQRVDRLTDDERAQLATFDKKLAEGRDSALRRKLESVVAEAETRTAEQLYDEGTEMKKLKHLEDSIVLFERCVKVDPTYHPCYRQMGSMYAAIAMRDQSAADMEKAKRSYQQFLAVAPMDDPFVPKVTAILDAANGNDDATPAREDPNPEAVVLVVGGKTTLTLGKNISRVALGDPSIAGVSVAGPRELRIEGNSEGRTTLLVWFSDNSRVSREINVKASLDHRTEKLFVEASMATTSNQWAKAFRLTQSLLKIAPNDTGGKKLEKEIALQAREFYLRGYQTRDVTPDEAIRMFKLVISMTTADDDTHMKAVSQLEKLER